MFQLAEDVERATSNNPNIFGFWRHLPRFSPFNSSKGVFQIPCTLFSLVVFLAMCFRIYWMFWQTHSEFLSYGWAEAKLYAFLTFESFSVLIGIFQITRRDSVHRFEMVIGTLQTLRVKKWYKEFDDYKKLHIRLMIWMSLIAVSIIGSAVYLFTKKEIIAGTTYQSYWFYILNFVINIFCFYVQLIYLPIHILINSAIRREIDVFNVDLEEALKDPKSEIFAKLETRQVTLLNFANLMTSRLAALLEFGGFTGFLAVLHGTYIVASFSSQVPIIYFIFNIALTISSILVTSILLYPQAIIQESLLATSKIILSTSNSQQQPADVVQNCRLMMNRSVHNRTTCTVIKCFDVTRKNIERTFFAITQIVIIMVVVYRFMSVSMTMGSVNV